VKLLWEQTSNSSTNLTFLMINKIKKFITKIVYGGKNQSDRKLLDSQYPIIHKNELYNISFIINNNIEDFRLRNWGGEKDYVIEMMKSLKEDDVFYDIGSSVGLISTIAAKCLTKGRVISFEPDLENLKSLKENLRLNKLINCKVLNIALGDKKDKLKLYTSGSNGFSPSLQKVNGIDSFVEIEVDTIDNLILKENLPFPDVIKIDIEGAEFMALCGMDKLLKSKENPRVIFIEIHPDFLPFFETSKDEILVYLNSLDYKMEHLIERERQVLCKLVRKK
jgi:FkbM family methyltransferase